MPDTAGIGHIITSQEIRLTRAPVSTVMKFVSCSGGIPKPTGPPVCGAIPIANPESKKWDFPHGLNAEGFVVDKGGVSSSR